MSRSDLPDDALIAELMEHPSESMALEELTQRMRPIIMTEALKYRSTLPYDSDDYMQEGRILLWKIALQNNYRRGSFKKYFATAIRFHLSNLFRDYVLRNYICIENVQTSMGTPFRSSLSQTTHEHIVRSTESIAAGAMRRSGRNSCLPKKIVMVKETYHPCLYPS